MGTVRLGGFVPLPRVTIGRGLVYSRCQCQGSLSRTAAAAAVPSRFIRRAYVQSSHNDLTGSKAEGGDRSASDTTCAKRPGPPLPSSSQKPSHDQPDTSSSSPSPINAPTIPSNKARPTLSDGRQSPNVDESGELFPDVPEDVKQHNREMEQRYDRAYNQIADKGTVEKGVWKKDRN